MPSKWKISFPHRFFHLCYWVTWRIRVFGTYREKGASQVVLVVKNPAANAGDAGSIPGLGRSPGGGHGNPLLYTCLENPMDRGVWQATVHRVPKSQTQLKWLSTHAFMQGENLSLCPWWNIDKLRILGFKCIYFLNFPFIYFYPIIF